MKTLLIAVAFFLSSCITSNDETARTSVTYTSSGIDTLCLAGNSFVWRNCPADYSKAKNISGTWENTTEEHASPWPTDAFWEFKVTYPDTFSFTVKLTVSGDDMLMYRDSSDVSIAYIKIR